MLATCAVGGRTGGQEEQREVCYYHHNKYGKNGTSATSKTFVVVDSLDMALTENTTIDHSSRAAALAMRGVEGTRLWA
jgi:hypothetical protein